MHSPANFINLSGKRFGRLVVIDRLPSIPPNYVVRWTCRCDCGKITSTRSKTLRNGSSKSCGCLLREIIGNIKRTHGMTDSREYRAWCHAKGRCNAPNDKGYIHYGGRGIAMSPEWSRSFETFLSDMGKCPDGLTLERKDVNRGYERENCVWATRSTQSNNRRSNIIVSFNGEQLTLANCARKAGVKYWSLYQLMMRGSTLEESLTRAARL